MAYGIEDILGDTDTIPFVDLIKRYFDQKDTAINIVDGILLISGKESKFGLYNLAQQCKGSPKDEWEKIVSTHFDNVLGQNDAGQNMSFTDAKDLLCIRIYPKADYAHLQDIMVYEEHLPDTYSALVIDLPQSVKTVNTDDFKRWGVDKEELFKIALDNTVRRYPVNPQSMPFVQDTTVQLIFEEHFFAATSLLNIEHEPKMLGKYGSLVAYPHRHAVLCQPINDLTVVKLISFLLPFLQMQYAQNPGPISPKLFWYHEKKYTELPYTIEGKSTNFIPPEEFVAMLNGLKS